MDFATAPSTEIGTVNECTIREYEVSFTPTLDITSSSYGVNVLFTEFAFTGALACLTSIPRIYTSGKLQFRIKYPNEPVTSFKGYVLIYSKGLSKFCPI